MMPARRLTAAGESMLAKPESACLVIADIAGYTDYLAGVELDHAQDILADLVDTVVGSLRPMFRLAKLEGDAAFAYALVDSLDGSLLQDTVEATYFSFRRRLRDIGQASRCECNACVLIPSLDLKFVVHHGLVVRQQMAGMEELLGRDVILVHRLLKNSVQATSGVRAYALYTDQAMSAMDADPAAQGLVRHREHIDVIGEVGCWIRDLEAAWSEEQARTRVMVAAEDAYAVIEYVSPAPPSLTWEYVTSPVRRPQWGAGIERIDEVVADGRRGIGTTNHCVHGRDAIVEEILDWRPFEYQTVRSALPDPSLPRILMTDVLTPLPDGRTRVEVRIGRPALHEQDAFDALFHTVEPMIREGGTALVEVLTAAVRRRDDAARLTPEPDLPESGSRFLSDPVRSGDEHVDSVVRRSSFS
jgi:uncharacterized protein YndB with AHSA1/START domain